MAIKVGIVSQDQPENRFGTQKNYISFVEAAGGTPLLILPIDVRDFEEVYNIDALLLPGGADVNPLRYGEELSIFCGNQNPFLEYFDVKILPHLVGKIPIFGICRGLQTLNVVLGGTLHQHIKDHPISSYETDLVHEVYFTNLPKKSMKVNSFHHQAIKELAPGLKEEAYHGNITEAISNREKRIFAVQWHPERSMDKYSIDSFKGILK